MRVMCKFLAVVFTSPRCKTIFWLFISYYSTGNHPFLVGNDVVIMETLVFRHATPCRPVQTHRCSVGSHCLHFPCQVIERLGHFSRSTKAVVSSKTSITNYQSTRRNVPEDFPSSTSLRQPQKSHRISLLCVYPNLNTQFVSVSVRYVTLTA